MALLTEDDHRLIQSQPLGSSLDQELLVSLHVAEDAYSFISPLDGASDGPEKDCLITVSDLILRLASTKVARGLSPINNRSIPLHLAAIAVRVDGGSFSYTGFRPLVKLVIQKAPDYDIWSAALELLTKFSGVTRGPTYASAAITHSSAAREAAEEARQLVEA
ncbi:hypothetical protein FQN57_000783 [Myotisia sp. PD_48]|nr:hypothetical protein FQN57_000783 [Myotisia sp. PD_48]